MQGSLKPLILPLRIACSSMLVVYYFLFGVDVVLCLFHYCGIHGVQALSVLFVDVITSYILLVTSGHEQVCMCVCVCVCVRVCGLLWVCTRVSVTVSARPSVRPCKHPGWECGTLRPRCVVVCEQVCPGCIGGHEMCCNSLWWVMGR